MYIVPNTMLNKGRNSIFFVIYKIGIEVRYTDKTMFRVLAMHVNIMFHLTIYALIGDVASFGIVKPSLLTSIGSEEFLLVKNIPCHTP